MADWNGKVPTWEPLFFNGFIHSGITVAFDGEIQSETLDADPGSETEVDSDGFDSDDLDSDEDSVYWSSSTSSPITKHHHPI